MKWPFWNEMGPVWDELAEMAMGTHGKTILWMKCLLFTPPALMPAGHKNRQALHRTGFGPKMMKKQPTLPCQTCAAKAPPVLTPGGGHKNRQAPRPGPGPCKIIPRYVGPT